MREEISKETNRTIFACWKMGMHAVCSDVTTLNSSITLLLMHGILFFPPVMNSISRIL